MNAKPTLEVTGLEQHRDIVKDVEWLGGPVKFTPGPTTYSLQLRGPDGRVFKAKVSAEDFKYVGEALFGQPHQTLEEQDPGP